MSVIEGGQAVDFDPYADGPISGIVPATPAQREVWIASQISEAASSAFNLTLQVRLRGQLDRNALELAVASVIGRHESLRGSFAPDGRTFCISASAAAGIEYIDLDDLPGDDTEARLEALRIREAEESFDLARAPLIRLTVAVAGSTEQILLVTAHHSIADGWSMEVILEDLAQAYSAAVADGSAECQPAFGFSSYAAWLEQPDQRAAHERALSYWKGVFEAGIPVLDLPTDFTRPALRTFACETLLHDLDPSLVVGLRNLGARENCTFFVTILAAFATFLQRVSGQQDFTIGVPAAGQAAIGKAELVGHCANLLPLRLQIRGEDSFTETLNRVKAMVLTGLENQHCTFTELLPELKLVRDASRVPLVAATLNVGRQSRTPSFTGLQSTAEPSLRRSDNFEWTVNIVESGSNATIDFSYNSSLFAREMMLERLQNLEQLMRSITASPETPLSLLDILGETDRKSQLVTWNATGRECRPQSIQAFLRKGFADPTTEAVRMNASLSYAELESRSNRLARYLRSLGADRGALVGLSLERSPEMLVALLGILKSGAAYLPLDPAFPADRLQFMLADSGSRLLVTETTLLTSLPEFGGTTICVDRDREAIKAFTDEALAEDNLADDPCYVIYTSGSTGKPKGVQVLHRNVVNFLQSMAREPGLGQADRLLAVTTLSFDISVLELLLPLSVGATVVLASREESADGVRLKELLEAERISVMQATPSTWRLLLAAGWQGSERLKILCGGEALPRDLAATLVGCCGELWNLYGPTETTVWSTCCRIEDAGSPVLIGRPIDNTQVYVLDEQRQPVPLGVYGELYIGGAGVTAGYLNRPELTAERFVADPFMAGGRLYRTGDRVRYRADGRLEYHSRIDNQVKVRGFRIELGEIEAALASHPALQEAAVMVREDQPGDQRLVAYYVVEAGQALPTASELRSHLRQSLPDYMLPQHFSELAALPRTPNNKLDRNALPRVTAQQATAPRQHIEPESDTEKELAELWREILGADRIGADDNFFDLGGHSLASVQIIAWAKRTHGAALHPLSLVTDSLRKIAREIDRQRAPAAQKPEPSRPSLARRILGDLKSALRPSTG